jgi:hypothetical protein
VAIRPEHGLPGLSESIAEVEDERILAEVEQLTSATPRNKEEKVSDLLKKCDECGGPIGVMPASAKLFKVTTVAEPKEKRELCLKCLTSCINAASDQMKKDHHEQE